MNKYLLSFAILILLSFTSCSKETSTVAELQVNNATNCLQYFYNGTATNDNFIGTIRENDSETFEIDLGESGTVATLVSSSPSSACTSQLDVAYNVDLTAGEKTSLTIQ